MKFRLSTIVAGLMFVFVNSMHAAQPAVVEPKHKSEMDYTIESGANITNFDIYTVYKNNFKFPCNCINRRYVGELAYYLHFSKVLKDNQTTSRSLESESKKYLPQKVDELWRYKALNKAHLEGCPGLNTADLIKQAKEAITASAASYNDPNGNLKPNFAALHRDQDYDAYYQASPTAPQIPEGTIAGNQKLAQPAVSTVAATATTSTAPATITTPAALLTDDEARWVKTEKLKRAKEEADRAETEARRLRAEEDKRGEEAADRAMEEADRLLYRINQSYGFEEQTKAATTHAHVTVAPASMPLQPTTVPATATTATNAALLPPTDQLAVPTIIDIPTPTPTVPSATSATTSWITPRALVTGAIALGTGFAAYRNRKKLLEVAQQNCVIS